MFAKNEASVALYAFLVTRGMMRTSFPQNDYTVAKADKHTEFDTAGMVGQELGAGSDAPTPVLQVLYRKRTKLVVVNPLTMDIVVLNLLIIY